MDTTKVETFPDDKGRSPGSSVDLLKSLWVAVANTDISCAEMSSARPVHTYGFSIIEMRSACLNPHRCHAASCCNRTTDVVMPSYSKGVSMRKPKKAPVWPPCLSWQDGRYLN